MNREFQFGRSRYKVSAMLSRRSRNNVLVTDLSNQKEYALAHTDVLTALERTAPAKDNSQEQANRDRVNAAHAKFETLPPYGGDFRVRMDAESAIFEELSAISDEVGDGVVVGKMISYGVADGKAHYVLMRIGRQVEVAHVPIGDAYKSPVVRNGSMTLGHAEDAVRHADGMRRMLSAGSPPIK